MGKKRGDGDDFSERLSYVLVQQESERRAALSRRLVRETKGRAQVEMSIVELSRDLRAERQQLQAEREISLTLRRTVTRVRQELAAEKQRASAAASRSTELEAKVAELEAKVAELEAKLDAIAADAIER